MEVVSNLCTTNHELRYWDILVGTSVSVEGCICLKLVAV